MKRSEQFAALILGQMAGVAFANHRYDCKDRYWVGQMAAYAHSLGKALDRTFELAEQTAKDERPWVAEDTVHAFKTGLEIGREQGREAAEADAAKTKRQAS